jgi:O-antigen ligase
MSRFFSFLLYLALAGIGIGASAYAGVNYSTLTRGVEPPVSSAPQMLGTNTALELYAGDADLQRALDLVKGAGLMAIRQHFPWREIEPTRGNFDWAKWDRIVTRARAANLQIVAVLDTAPAWAQSQNERDLPEAPPDNFADYANFAAGFARRYSSQIEYYQVWDEPNVHPNWGRRNADPSAYGKMLHLAAAAIRANAPNAKIVLAGLGMNLETQRPHPDYSEILFLRGLYEAGEQNDFDIVAAKPYGMWTGPEDRRVSSNVLNFSRVILLRDEMKQHGDVDKPLWAVEMGWNALPDDWAGAPSPWGSDTQAVQADRLTRALARAHAEWGWAGALFPQTLEPDAPGDDPRWGFSLVTSDMNPRPFYTAIADFTAKPPPTAPAPTPPWAPIALLGGVVVIAAWRAARLIPTMPAAAWWDALRARFLSLPELVQFAVLACAVVAFYYSPSVPLNLLLLVLLIPLFALRLDLGMALLVFSIPFFLYPKTLFGGFELSLVEVLTLACAAAWVWRFALTHPPLPPLLKGGRLKMGPLLKGGRPNIPPLLKGQRLNIPPLLEGQRLNMPSLLKGGRPNMPPLAKRGRLDMPPLAKRGERLNISPLGKEERLNIPPLTKGGLGGVTSLDWAVIAFVVLGIISTRVAANFGVASREFRVIVIEPALLYALLRLANLTHAQVWRLVNALLLAGAAVCLIGLAQFATGDLIVGEGVSRVRSVWGSPNNAALFLGRLLPLALALALFLRGSRLRWLYVVLAILLALTLYLTYSLGALVLGIPAGIALIALVWWWPNRRRLRIRHVALVGLALVAAVILVAFAGGPRLQTLFQTGTGTGFFRIAVWTSALHMIRDHPLFGVGLDNFLYEYPKYILPEAWREPNLSHPHNVLLDFWVRQGVLGVLVLIWLEVEFFLRAWHMFRQEGDLATRALAVGLSASMVDFLAHGMVDAAYFVVDLAFVFMLTLGVAASLTAAGERLEREG